MKKSILVWILFISGCSANVSYTEQKSEDGKQSGSVSAGTSTLAVPQQPTQPQSGTLQQTCPDPETGAFEVKRVLGSSERVDYPNLNSIDCNKNSFVTTNSLLLGDVFKLAYELKNTVSLSKIEFHSRPSDGNLNIPCLGDLLITVSSDSTNGVDGSWRPINIQSSSYSHLSQKGQILFTPEANIKWVKLTMTYNGTGAHGGTPSFYLNEILFFNN